MKNAVYFFIIFFFALGITRPVFVFSAVQGNTLEIEQLNKEIEAKKKKIELLEKSISEYKTKIAQKQLEAVSLNNQMAIVNNRISEVDLDIKATEEKIGSLTLEIKSLNLGIEDKEKVVERQKIILAGLIRNLYLENDRNYIEIAAAHNSFSDFYNQLQYVQTIDQELGKSVKTLRGIKEELQDKKTQTEERKKSYDDLKKELEGKKADYKDQVNYKATLLTQTQSSEAKYQTLLASLKAQYQQIENEVSSIEQEVRRKLEAANKLDNIPGDSTQLSWPTQSRYLTARFHDPDYPYRHVFEHTGIDIRAGHGTALKAVASGYVARAKHCSLSSCYSYVMLVHSSGIATVYGHMSGITVSEDQFVTRGDVIGYSGGTPGTVGAGPFVTGPHLHFEVRKDGIPVNPLNYLVQDW